MDVITKTVIERLAKKGMEPPSIPAFIRNIANTIASDVAMKLSELNRRMELLGWGGIEFDEYTLGLILAIFDSNDDVDVHKHISR